MQRLGDVLLSVLGRGPVVHSGCRLAPDVGFLLIYGRSFFTVSSVSKEHVWAEGSAFAACASVHGGLTRYA